MSAAVPVLIQIVSCHFHHHNDEKHQPQTPRDPVFVRVQASSSSSSFSTLARSVKGRSIVWTIHACNVGCVWLPLRQQEEEKKEEENNPRNAITLSLCDFKTGRVLSECHVALWDDDKSSSILLSDGCTRLVLHTKRGASLYEQHVCASLRQIQGTAMIPMTEKDFCRLFAKLMSSNQNNNTWITEHPDVQVAQSSLWSAWDHQMVDASSWFMWSSSSPSSPSFSSPSSNLPSLMLTSNHKKRRRVKPYPNPLDVPGTEYLSEDEIRHKTLERSTSWITTSNVYNDKNKLLLYIEVLSCHDLPNVDVGEAVGNVTDAFVTLAIQDVWMQTDVVDDELSPHWLPWTQRAFCVPLLHRDDNVNSLLYIAVSDYDVFTNHDPLGRIAISTAHLVPGVEYTLEYALHMQQPAAAAGGGSSGRRPRIKLRMRMEENNINNNSLSPSITPPDSSTRWSIHCHRKKTWQVLRYTCGIDTLDQDNDFDLAVTRAYIAELLHGKQSLGYVLGDAWESVRYWKGQVVVCASLPPLPLISLVLYLSLSAVVEDPGKLIPLLLFGCPAMILWATHQQQVHHPNPWQRQHIPPSLMDWTVQTIMNLLDKYFFTAKHNESRAPNPWTTPALAPLPIRQYQGHAESRAKQAAWDDRIARDQQQRALFQQQQQQKDAEDAAAATGSGTSATNTGMRKEWVIPTEWRDKLGRYQGMLAMACQTCRRCQRLALWNDPGQTFCLWLVCGMLWAATWYLPWAWMMQTIGRILVHGLLGPHMKIVHWRNLQEQQQDVGSKQQQEEAAAVKDVRSGAADMDDGHDAQTRAWKSLYFGHYSIQVPSPHQAHVAWDTPLPTSMAVPYTNHQEDKEEHRNLTIRPLLVPHSVSLEEMIPIIPGWSNNDAEEKNVASEPSCHANDNEDDDDGIETILVAASPQEECEKDQTIKPKQKDADDMLRIRLCSSMTGELDVD